MCTISSPKYCKYFPTAGFCSHTLAPSLEFPWNSRKLNVLSFQIFPLLAGMLLEKGLLSQSIFYSCHLGVEFGTRHVCRLCHLLESNSLVHEWPPPPPPPLPWRSGAFVPVPIGIYCAFLTVINHKSRKVLGNIKTLKMGKSLQKEKLGAFTLLTSRFLKSRHFDPTIYTCAKKSRSSVSRSSVSRNFTIFWLVVRMCDHRLQCMHSCSMHEGRGYRYTFQRARIASSPEVPKVTWWKIATFLGYHFTLANFAWNFATFQKNRTPAWYFFCQCFESVYA